MPSKTNSGLMFYAQDPGGAKFMAPILAAFLKRQAACSDNIILIHPLSEASFTDINIPFVRLVESFRSLPVSVSEWKDFLNQKEIHHLVTTTSSPYRDLTNCSLIQAAKTLNIPILGILDHWKGLDRFFEKGQSSYLPDHILCIDALTKRELVELGISADKIHPVGHPYLESLKSEIPTTRRNGDTIKILLISQPATFDRSFDGVFHTVIEKESLAGHLFKMLALIQKTTGFTLELAVRPHPKERMRIDDHLPFRVDNNADWDKVRDYYDVFIGVDSMALVEAFLVGKFCVRLALPELSDYSDCPIPFVFDKHITNLQECEKDLLDVVEAVSNGDYTYQRDTTDLFYNSLAKALSMTESFTRGSL